MLLSVPATANEYDVQINDTRVWAAVAFVITFAVAASILYAVFRITETKMNLAARKTEHYRLEVKKAEAQRDEVVIRGGYERHSDGSIYKKEV